MHTLLHFSTYLLFSIFKVAITAKVPFTLSNRDPNRDGWIKEFIKKVMSFLGYFGQSGLQREKKLPIAISMQIFGVVFSTFCGYR